MYSDEMRHKFIQLRAGGYSYRRIAEELGITYDTVLRWANLYKDIIHNLREYELDSIKELCYVAKIRRLEVLGDVFGELRKNLENKKKFNSLSPKELLDYLAKFAALLRAEDTEEEPEFRDVPGELPKDDDFGPTAGAAA